LHDRLTRIRISVPMRNSAPLNNQTPMDHSTVSELAAKLDVLLCVAAAQVGKELSLAERAPLLSRLGLDRNQIARVCDTSADVVSVRLAEARRKTGRQKVAKKRTPKRSKR